MTGMDMQQGIASGYPVAAAGMVHNMGVRIVAFWGLWRILEV